MIANAGNPIKGLAAGFGTSNGGGSSGGVPRGAGEASADELAAEAEQLLLQRDPNTVSPEGGSHDALWQGATDNVWADLCPYGGVERS